MSTSRVHETARTPVLDVAEQTPEAAGPARPVPLAGVAALTVGAADDRAEHDADVLADRALRRLHAGAGEEDAQQHRHGAGCGHLRRSAAAPAPGAVVGREGGDLDAATTAAIEGRRGRGAPLPGGVRRSMESAFGTRLGHVRVHTDPAAAGLNARVAARAFTTGSDIFFGAGQFAPGTPEGRQVLAHELAHVVSEPGPGVHRLFGGIGRAASRVKNSVLHPRETPTERAAREIEEERKRQDKDARKKREEEERAGVKRSKVLETSERAALKQSRKDGVAGRTAMTSAVYGEGTEWSDPVERHAGLAEAGSHLGVLQQMFEDALRFEKAAVSHLVKEHAGDPTWTDERIADQAYRETWLEGLPAEHLKHVRPPRETAAERLVIDVRRARTAANVRKTVNDEAAARTAAASVMGTLLPPEVEAVYESYVSHIDAAMQADPTLDPLTAAAQGEAVVWATTVAKIRTKRPPQGSALDLAAIDQARERLGLRQPPAPDERDTLTRAEDAVGTVGGYAGTGSTVAGLLVSAGGALVKDPEETKKPEAESPGLLAKGLSKLPLHSEITGAQKQVAAKQRSKPSDPLTTKDNVIAGITSVREIVTGLTGAVQSALKFAKATKRAYEDPDPRKALAAAKAGVDGLKGLNSTARSTANLAKAISPSVTESVGKVIPGFNIAGAALGVVSNAIDLADRSLRLGQTNETIFQARSRDKAATAVDVLVHPMLGLAQSYTKQVEKASWDTGVAVSDLATAIATVASGGGYGIPAAVQAGVKLLDTLHSLGHFVADEVLVEIARTAERESAVLHLEGGAENELRKHPAMAVDGIIMRAVRGDQVAQSFLATYEVDGRPISLAMLRALDAPDLGADAGVEDGFLTIRNAVLDDLGAEADPQHAYTTYKKKAGAFLGGVRASWRTTGDLATKRNKMDDAATGGAKGHRGLAWRLKMMLRGQEATTRSVNRTAVLWTHATGGVDTEGAAVVCGTHVLPAEPTDAELTAFLDGIGAMSTDEILKHTANPANDAAAREFLLCVCAERWKEEERTSV
ncbi:MULTISPECIES: DUF4157 domain-containing protein [Georgenia]|uniref:eCIS core domain-containing protein n=1 Tax=Georgenia TaxID=154116 RepID=UPI001C3F2F81|nr:MULTISPECIES: DUF4157 domain-containing protein [Georgenia]